MDRIRSGSKPSAAMVLASSRDASPNACQLRVSRSSSITRPPEPSIVSCPRHQVDDGRATIRAATVLLGGVEPVVTEHGDELAADVIDSGGSPEFSAFATSRWPGLVRLAF